jgi:hypothetical protein
MNKRHRTSYTAFSIVFGLLGLMYFIGSTVEREARDTCGRHHLPVVEVDKGYVCVTPDGVRHPWYEFKRG